MNRFKSLHLELHKLRRRLTGAMFFAVFAVMTVWIFWCMKDLDPSRINDVSGGIYLNMLLMNTILSPITLAALASRMCDMEQAGSTWKWLCTLQRPEDIYRGKVLAGALYLAVFSLMQTGLFGVLMALFGNQPPGHYMDFFAGCFFPGLLIFILQLNLSLRFTNQLTPIFLSIGGTFVGLFSWFLHQTPLRYLIPWGYYAALCSTGYDYDRATRSLTYYWFGYPFFWLAVSLLASLGLYRYGRRHFLAMVREMI